MKEQSALYRHKKTKASDTNHEINLSFVYVLYVFKFA